MDEGAYLFIPGGYIVCHRGVGNTLAMGFQAAALSPINMTAFLHILDDTISVDSNALDLRVFLAKVCNILDKAKESGDIEKHMKPTLTRLANRADELFQLYTRGNAPKTSAAVPLPPTQAVVCPKVTPIALH